MEVLRYRQKLADKIKILLDCVHQKGQPYFGLTTEKIILDDEGNVYLAPYSIDLFNDYAGRRNNTSSEWPNGNSLLFKAMKDEGGENLASYVQAYYSPELLECAHKSVN